MTEMSGFDVQNQFAIQSKARVGVPNFLGVSLF
jgi:hypothetical protein